MRLTVWMLVLGMCGALGAGPCECGCKEEAICSCQIEGCKCEKADCHCGCEDKSCGSCQCGCEWGKKCGCRVTRGVSDYKDRTYARSSSEWSCRAEDWSICQWNAGVPFWKFCWGDWVPEDPPLWRQFVADPRALTYSAGWRFNDDALAKDTIPVSFGDYFALYRWHGVWPYCGSMEIGVEGAVWAVFDPLHESSPLIDADYYIGFPLVYAFDNWQFRLRGYHISTHLGDEFLLNHPGFDRRNPSAEYIDFYGSYYFGDQIRIYAGLGYIVHQDNSFRYKRFFQALGMEVRALGYGYYDSKQRLLGHPYFGAHVRGSRDYKRHIDQTYVLGYEWVKLAGLERATRIFIEYHDGYSVDGQFCDEASTWFAVKLSYGF